MSPRYLLVSKNLFRSNSMKSCNGTEMKIILYVYLGCLIFLWHYFLYVIGMLYTTVAEFGVYQEHHDSTTRAPVTKNSNENRHSRLGYSFIGSYAMIICLVTLPCHLCFDRCWWQSEHFENRHPRLRISCLIGFHAKWYACHNDMLDYLAIFV